MLMMTNKAEDDAPYIVSSNFTYKSSDIIAEKTKTDTATLTPIVIDPLNTR
jgi:hypothetical protein